MALIDDDVTFEPGPLDPDSNADAARRPSFQALVPSWLDAFDEVRIEPLDVIEDGDKLIAAAAPVWARQGERR
jgi:hypothetical protein